MVSANNAINNTVGASITGVTNTLTVTNPSDTASSVARTTITVGGSSAGDPSLNFNVSGVTDFEMGIDNNASDSFKLSASTALGTTDTFVMTPAGERTMPLQPAFLATLGGAVVNVTGDGTGYTLIFLTEAFDQNADYNNATGVFTAPVTGRYYFDYSFNLTSLGAAHSSARGFIVSSEPRVFTTDDINGANARTNSQTLSLNGSALVPLTAGDTVTIQANVNGGTKTVGIQTGYFSGFLAV